MIIQRIFFYSLLNTLKKTRIKSKNDFSLPYTNQGLIQKFVSLRISAIKFCRLL